MHSDGSHRHRLTRTADIDETDPTRAPSGKEIVFAITEPASLEGIWVIGVDGRHRRQLTSEADANPSWSPDGRRIAYVGESSSHGASSYQLYVSRASGANRRAITHACGG